MTTNEQADQLELAAKILRTGHPWGYRILNGALSSYSSPIGVITDGNFLIPLLATPPDGRPLHNPDNLTAEQVGVGYRLTLGGDDYSKAQVWHCGKWQERVLPAGSPRHEGSTYRLPMPVPWPELPIATLAKDQVELATDQHAAVDAVLKGTIHDPYAALKAAHKEGRVIEVSCGGQWVACFEPSWFGNPDQYRIKPEPEPFQLPQPPPGIEWHDSGWTAEMLPRGVRPLHIGEQICKDDEYFARNEGPWRKAQDGPAGDKSGNYIEDNDVKYRTTRPLTFTHGGEEWTWHKAGDPMPCDGESHIHIICHEGRTTDRNGELYSPRLGRWNMWNRTLGWRYAEPATRVVDLGPEDVPPGSFIRSKTTPQAWESIGYLGALGIFDYERKFLNWRKLAESYEINRSIPLTGRWNPNAWEPCHKQIPA